MSSGRLYWENKLVFCGFKKVSGPIAVSAFAEERCQGLMVAAGNPKSIVGIMDLKRGDIRFVNRQAGSGTRLEMDRWLLHEGIAPTAVIGYDTIETTHLAVAAAVASGEADAGVGIQAAAFHFGLDFIPLAREQYYFVCLKETPDTPAVIRLCELLQHSQWQDSIRNLAGYDTVGTGKVVALRQALPWFTFRKPKA